MTETLEKVDETKSDEEQFQDALFKLKWGIDYWIEAFQKIPAKLKEEIQATKEYGFEDLAKELTTAIEQIKQFEKTVDSKRRELSEQLEMMAAETYDKYKAAKRKIEELPEIKTPEINTHKLENMIGLLDKISAYNPKEWEKFSLIAQRLGMNNCTDDCPFKTFKNG